MEKAIQDGNLEKVVELIEAGADINLKSNTGATPLFDASYSNKFEIVKYLVDKGADINNPNNNGTTPLFISLILGHFEIMKYLIEKGADVNKPDKYGNKPLYMAVTLSKNFDTLKLLIDAGANVNVTDRKGTSLLFLATETKNIDNVKLLIAAGVDLNKPYMNGTTPLHKAIAKKYTEIAKALIDAGAEVNTEKTDDKETPLMAATIQPNLDIVKLLLEKGADPNKQVVTKNTALIYSINNDQYDISKALLDKGADPNKQNELGMTALMIAANKEKLKTVELLLEKRADPNIVDTKGRKATDYTISDEIIDLLAGKKPETPAPYSGKSKSDIEFFNVFLGSIDATTTEEQAKNNIKNTGFCPVCLEIVYRSIGCLYMHHVCQDTKRHDGLYNKYKNETGEIWWCVDCCRICKGHRHYAIGLANAAVPALMESGSPHAFTCDSSDKRDIEGYVNPATGLRIDPAKSNGGGSTTEKLKRVARMIDYAFELQHSVGDISEKEAKHELIEEVWNAATMRMRFDPLKFKRWKTDLSVFTDTAAPTETVIPEAIPTPGDIENPVVHDEPGVESSLLDDPPIIEFKHKNKDGVMFNHVHGDEDKRFIGKVSLVNFMKTMGEKLGKCFDVDCEGWLWPQEIEMAFNDPKLKDSVTDEDRAILKSYKERFNAAKAPKTGGAKWKFNFLSDMENGQCYLPKKNAGNRTRKNKKRAKKTRRA